MTFFASCHEREEVDLSIVVRGVVRMQTDLLALISSQHYSI